MITQALAGIDDTTVLLDERPVAVDSLWRHIIASSTISSSAEGRAGSLTLLHPSWWPPGRVARIVDAASGVAADVQAIPRAALLTARNDSAATVVEINDDAVAICPESGTPTLLARSVGADAIAAKVAALGGPASVLIDAPHGVRNAREFSGAIRTALRHLGVTASPAHVGDEVAYSATEPSLSARRSWLPAQVGAAAAVAIVMCGVGVATTRPSAAVSPVTTAAVSLVEGRVSMRIPAGWTVTRVTAGPGSRRVEIGSPVDHSTALHLTQSYAPQETLGAAAEALRRAIAKEEPGTFVDFEPADQRAGRDAVTYREIRAGRDIRWSVVLAGSTRISIGCQSTPGRQDTVDDACEEAIRSARELGGTERKP